MSLKTRVEALPDMARDAADTCGNTLNVAPTALEAHRTIARGLGAQVQDAAAGIVRFGFWTPELLDARVPEGDVFLEIIAPHDGEIDLTTAHARTEMERIYLPAARYEGFTFAAARGVRAGTRERVGDFYALAWRDAEGEWHRILDPLAASLPFGAFAPAEVYDTQGMQAQRGDAAYFARIATPDQPAKLGPPGHILQIHVPTATAGGTLAALTRQITRIAERTEAGLDLEPYDQLFADYDAVQLLPVEPTTVYETGPGFWQESDGDGDDVTVDMTRPDTTNWGYDVVIAGMAAVNPCLLESGRPDELQDLVVALHGFPGGAKKLILDVVYGHSDNQGLAALPPHYFAGPNMYGQNLAYRNPAVRAILQEMQRRKVNFGADGVRVDGAQDFKWWDTATQELRHDDAFLQEMSDTVQEVAGTAYRPWFVFEDGRPWPEEDWELSSSYRSVIETQRDTDVFQWGPLTFAHNTPFLYTFWLSKYWRIREMLQVGAHWISGTANHDTLRRGTQVNPKLNINTRLGETQMEILDKAYDNPAVSMLTYAVFPGVPMDFINATARANWGFIRNQDDKYGVKVVAEEAISLKWQVDTYAYSVPGNFRRLKDLGFETREDLARFFDFLPALVEVTDYDLPTIARLLNAVEPPLAGPGRFDVGLLKDISRAWMDDMHEYCNVTHSIGKLDGAQTGFQRSLRRFRSANMWLRENFGPRDHFDYLQPIAGRTVFTALRHGPGSRASFTVAHMEGQETADIDPLALDIPGLAGGGWQVALRSPSIGPDYEGGPIILKDSMALTFTRD